MKNVYSLARALGWFSVGLGLMELFGSEELDNFLGTKGRSGIVRLFGLRELGAGVGILASSQPKAGSGPAWRVMPSTSGRWAARCMVPRRSATTLRRLPA